MSDSYYKHVFPQTLTKPQRIAGLQYDEAFFLFLFGFGGFFLDYVITGIIVGFVCVAGLRYLKKGRPTKFLLDYIYWNFPSYCSIVRYKKMPDSYLREWVK